MRLIAATLAVSLLAACTDSDKAPFVPAPGALPRTVVLISLDTLRADRLGIHGNTPDVSPRIDALANDAIVYDRAFAPAPWTLPSHMSMLTGLDPVAHGMRNDDHRLAPGIVTLAEALQEEGFLTAAFTDGGFVDSAYGFADGFTDYEDDRDGDQEDNGWKRILPDAIDWLEDLDDTERAFVFLHTFDAHAPFRNESPYPDVVEEFRKRPVGNNPRDHLLPRLEYFGQQAKFELHEYGRLEELLNDYDAGVHIADRGTGAIVDTLRELGRYDDALIIVTSDHGESMLEQGLHVGHGMFLSSNETHIPLVMKLPGGRHAGTRSHAIVDLVDIAPTVLDVVEAPAVADMQGQSLAAVADGAKRTRSALLQLSGNINTFALITPEYRYHTPIFGNTMAIANRHLAAVTPPMGNWSKPVQGKNGEEMKYDKRTDPLGLKDHFERTEELYELDTPTEAMKDLAGLRPDVTSALRETFLDMLDESVALGDALIAREGAGVKGATSSSSKEQLEKLGYVDVGKPSNAEGAETPDPRRTDRIMREALPKLVSKLSRKGHVPPDTKALASVDRQVHQLRLLLAGGADLPKHEVVTRCRDAGSLYIDWAEANPAFASRAIWRMFELNELAKSDGVALDIEPWLERGKKALETIHGDPEDDDGR